MNLLQKDLKLIEQFHFVEYESSVLSRISLSYQGLLEQEFNKQLPSYQSALQLFNQAQEKAQEAFDVAQRLKQERDLDSAQSSLDKLQNDFQPRLAAISV